MQEAGNLIDDLVAENKRLKGEIARYKLRERLRVQDELDRERGSYRPSFRCAHV